MYTYTVNIGVNTGRYYRVSGPTNTEILQPQTATVPSPVASPRVVPRPAKARVAWHSMCGGYTVCTPERSPAQSCRSKYHPRAASAHDLGAQAPRESDAGATLPRAPRPGLHADAVRIACPMRVVDALQTWTLTCDLQGSTRDPHLKPPRARAREGARERA